MRVPRVEVDDVRIDIRRIPIQPTLYGGEDGVEGLGRGVGGRVAAVTHGLQREMVHADLARLRTVAAHLHLDELGEFPRKVIHMHPGSAVNRWGIFVGEKKGFHRMGNVLCGEDGCRSKARLRDSKARLL
jgi:hypothetical protein